MASQINIRIAKRTDISGLERIAKAAGNFDAGYFDKCFDVVDAGKRLVFLAESARQICGYGLYVRNPGYRPFRRLNIPEIQDLNVLPNMRKRGIGGQMIEFAESLAVKDGTDMMGIAVGLHSSYGAAQRLYIRMGYVPDGAGVFYDNEPVGFGKMRPLDDNYTLKMTKAL